MKLQEPRRLITRCSLWCAKDSVRMSLRRPSRKRAFFEDDGGFSTAGMALALLLTLSLLFTSAQVYRIHSACADVQNVADASALAAENQVSSYYLVAQICDAVVLSLSLAGIVCVGAGVAALCIPAAQPIGEKLIEAGDRVLDARTRFSKSAQEGLNRIQQLLPFFAAAQAARVALANSNSTSSYLGVALLVPFEGQQLIVDEDNEFDDLSNQAQEQQDEIEQAAQDAEDAAKRADMHKQRAYEADCGANPSYCMYERAGKLAGLSGASNPYFGNAEIWSFSAALKRAQAYYPRRLAQEAPANGSIEEQGSSVLRKHFYTYACNRIAQGYVHETETSFDAHFPLLPRNTSEMRKTELYTQALYPITDDGIGGRVMHAWVGCPRVQEQGSVGNGSIQQCESEGMATCDLCEFSASRVGKIAAASTSTSNGFEHYYRIVAEEAQAYEKARKELEDASNKVRNPVDSLMKKLKQALSQAAKRRIEVHPPGAVGAIALVVDTKGVSASSLVPSSFVSGAGSLGTRAAISAATLAPDNPDETAHALGSLFDGLVPELGSFAQLPQVAAGLWGHALFAYLEGQQSLEGMVKGLLDSLPLVGKSGLGTWAANKMHDSVEAVGLQPVELTSEKPVIVNSYHVASADGGAIAQGLLGIKGAYSSAAGAVTGNALGVLVGVAGGKLQGAIAGFEDGIVVAHIQFFGESGPGIDVRLPLPPAVHEGAQGLVESAVVAIQGLANQGNVVRRWE